MLAPTKARVPPLVLLMLAELPLKILKRVRVSEVSISKTLVPEAAKLIDRLELKVEETLRIPPSSKAKLPVPRLLSAETLTVPADIVVAAV